MNWWSAPSTWAPQRGQIVWTRQMDHLVLAHIDGDEGLKHVRTVAYRVGCTPEAVHTRIVALRCGMANKHWKSGATQ